MNAKAEDKKPVIIKQTLIPLNLGVGSEESLNLMREILFFENQEIYKYEYVIHLIKYKWLSIHRINNILLCI